MTPEPRSLLPYFSSTTSSHIGQQATARSVWSAPAGRRFGQANEHPIAQPRRPLSAYCRGRVGCYVALRCEEETKRRQAGALQKLRGLIAQINLAGDSRLVEFVSVVLYAAWSAKGSK